MVNATAKFVTNISNLQVISVSRVTARAAGRHSLLTSIATWAFELATLMLKATMNKFRATIAGPFALVVFLAACRDQAPTMVAETGTRQEAVAVKVSRIRPEEKLLFDIEAKAPGFGGFYVDEASRVHTWIKSSGDADLARNAIQRAFVDGTLATSRNGMPASFVAEAAQFTVSELATWRDLIFDVSSLNSVALFLYILSQPEP